MKRIFNHRKRPYNDKIDFTEWEDYEEQEESGYGTDDTYYADGQEEEYYEEPAVYVEDESVYESGEIYYTEDGESEEEYYTDDTAESEEEYYADEDAESEEGYYEEAVEGQAGYYAEDYEQEEEYREGEYYAEGYESEEEWPYEEDGSYYEEEKKKRGIFAFFANMGTMDKIITCTGVLVLIVALIAGGVYLGVKGHDKQVEGFVSVGSQLAQIHLPGEAGLMAVADAVAAKKAAADALKEQEQQKQEEEDKDYKEHDYTKLVTVKLVLTSIQKDLKIKFVNDDTGKLISNVPFMVSVTTPDGKTVEWSDDDMDGIIYKTGLTAGTYKVLASELEGEKYRDYYLPSATKSAEVKKNIEYKKVDVKNEIKTEAEVNVKQEDTKKNETQVEVTLTDTVQWVESTIKPTSYLEVEKTTILDPMVLLSKPVTTAYLGGFMRLSQVATAPSYSIDPGTKSLKVGEDVTLDAVIKGVDVTKVTWTSSDPSVAKVEAVNDKGLQVKVTALKKGTAAISYKVDGTTVSGGDAVTDQQGATCMVTVTDAALTKGTVTVDKEKVNVAVESTAKVKATAAGFAEGKALAYKVTTSKDTVAKVTYDHEGNISITGVAPGEAEVTVSVNYKDAAQDKAAETEAKCVIKVKVGEKITLKLDKETATAFVEVPLVLEATLTNAPEDAVIKAESSDTNVATVKVEEKNVTVTGLKVGSATITVKYVENDTEVKAVCTVTVKANPKKDKTTKLLDVNELQIYVLDNGVYREAVYADYYTAEKFYVKGNATYTGWQTIDGKVYYFDAAGKKVTGEQVIQGAKYYFDSYGALSTGSGIRGIDVSKWNGNIDWKAVKNSGIEYVIIRSGYRGSSQGALIEDPKFKSNIKGATEAGLKVGVYFFTQAISEAEAIEEASMVLEQVKNYQISYPIFLDVEASGGRADGIDKATRTAVCKAFCQTIQSGGYTAGIYANKNWLDTKLDASALSAYKIWLAQYAATPTYTGRYDLWQYQSTGKVSGISGNVDMNWSYLGY